MEDPGLRSFLTAVQVLYSPDSRHEARGEADTWLKSFQRSSRAWEVCDGALSRQALPPQAYFLAAQTLREKVRYDWDELSSQQVRVTLREAVLRHLAQHQAAAQVRKMLALAVVGIAVHMVEDWEQPGPLETLTARFGSPGLADALLEILAAAPEEAANPRLRCSEDARTRAMASFQAFSVPCVGILLRYMHSTGSNRALQLAVLECFRRWVALGSIPDAELAGGQLFNATFDALRVPELFEVAMRIVSAMLRMSHDVNKYNATVDAIIPRVLALVPALDGLMAEGRADDPEAASQCLLFAAIFTDLGESYLPLLMNGSPPAMKACEAILKCSAHPDRAVSSRTFPFWYSLRRAIASIRDQTVRDHKRSVFGEAFSSFARVTVRGIAWPADFDRIEAERDKCDDYEDIRRHRHLAGDALCDCCEVLGPAAVLSTVCAAFDSTWRAYVENPAQWQQIEALLFAIRSIASSVVPMPDRTLIAQVLAVLPQFKQHHMPRYTALLLCGRYARVLNDRPDLLGPALTYIVASLDDRHLVSAAVQSLRYVCRECAPHLLVEDYVGQMLGVAHKYVTGLKLDDSKELIEAMAILVTELADASVPGALQRLLLPLANSLVARLQLPAFEQQSKAARTGVCHDLERIAHVFSTVDPALRRAVVPEALAGLLQQMWELFGGVLRAYSGDGLVMEALCLCWNRGIRKTGLLFEPMLLPLVGVLTRLFPEHRHSCFLYVASVLVKVFGPDQRYHETLRGAFDVLTRHVLTLLADEAAFTEMPDVVDDYFDVVLRYIRVCPELLLQHQLFPAVVECGLRGLGVDHREACAALMKMFAALIMLGVPQKGYQPPSMVSGVLDEVFQRYGAALAQGLVAGVAGRLSYSRVRFVHGVLDAMVLYRRDATAQLVQSALASSAPETQSPTKAVFLQRWLAASRPDDRKHQLCTLSAACRRATR